MSVWFPPGIQSESVPCDHCGSPRERTLFEGPDRLHHLPGTFRVVECLECGWLRQNPRPTGETIGYYYPAEYVNFIRAVEDEPHRWKQWDRRYGILKRRRAVERFGRRGRLLDVGCATGVFLHEMQQAGWDVVGIEPNEGAAEYARSRFGLPVRTGTLRTAALPANSFDVVTLWDVLEHLHTPWTDLIEARRLLKESGLLVLRWPNLESLERRWFGQTWLGWDLPRHLYYFPREILMSAIDELGLEAKDLRSIAGGHAAMVLGLQFHLEDRHFPLTRWSQWLLWAAGSAPARLVGAPFFWWLGKARRSSLITLFAQKRASSEPEA
jgi:SAM-dependent methyltransferase